MARRVAKHTIGILDNRQNTYRRDAVSTSIWKRGSYPAEVGLTSYSVDNYDERKNSGAMHLQLGLVDEVRAVVE